MYPTRGICCAIPNKRASSLCSNEARRRSIRVCSRVLPGLQSPAENEPGDEAPECARAGILCGIRFQVLRQVLYRDLTTPLCRHPGCCDSRLILPHSFVSREQNSRRVGRLLSGMPRRRDLTCKTSCREHDACSEIERDATGAPKRKTWVFTSEVATTSDRKRMRNGDLRGVQVENFDARGRARCWPDCDHSGRHSTGALNSSGIGASFACLPWGLIFAAEQFRVAEGIHATI